MEYCLVLFLVKGLKARKVVSAFRYLENLSLILYLQAYSVLEGAAGEEMKIIKLGLEEK